MHFGTKPGEIHHCFDQAVANGFFISDVTLSRGQHHQLVIAIRHDLDNGGFFVLRATLDASLLDSPIAQLDLDETVDVFIVNSHGVLQTSSRHYGNRFEKVPLAHPRLPWTAPGC
jgi:two-component system NtrC family sensor kinase